MNRIIKFRGKMNNQWWYATPEDDHWDQFWAIVNHDTIKQFIGVLDKDGKEVYEGDHCITEHGPGWIVYDHTKMAWIIQGFNYWEYVHEELDMQSRMVTVKETE
jgi:hypothetical protein